MRVTQSTVTKILIQDIEHLDPISLYLEDYGAGKGRVTISCFNDSWTHWWGAMGDGYDARRFLLTCDNDYLIRKFEAGIQRTVDDYDALVESARRNVIERRKSNQMDKQTARRLYDEADGLGEIECRELLGAHNDDLTRYFGDEWYDCLPQKPNPKYQYVDRIITTVKDALRVGPITMGVEKSGEM